MNCIYNSRVKTVMINKGVNMKYKCIAFDMDGTLLNSEKAGLLSLQKTVEVYLHKKVEIEELHFSLGIPGFKAIEMLGIEKAEEALEYWDDMYLKMCEEIDAFDHVEEVLKMIKEKGYLLGLVTSGFHKDVDNQLARLGLKKYFDGIITAEECVLCKPHAEPLLNLLSLLNLNRKDVVYIGDSKYDQMCAKEAQIDFGVAQWGTIHKDMDATYHFENMLDVLRIV